MKTLRTSLLTLGFLVAVAFAGMWSGLYNIAATEHHTDLTSWFLAKARNRSITVHSRNIRLPLSGEPGLITQGFHHYHGMCRLCHGAPGYSRVEFAQGLYPLPADLASADVQKRPDAEIFWIINNGIKMTGMPAFGGTHGEDELQGLLLFVRRVSTIDSNEYEEMVEAAGFKTGAESHEHIRQQGDREEHSLPEQIEHHHNGHGGN